MKYLVILVLLYVVGEAFGQAGNDKKGERELEKIEDAIAELARYQDLPDKFEFALDKVLDDIQNFLETDPTIEQSPEMQAKMESIRKTVSHLGQMRTSPTLRRKLQELSQHVVAVELKLFRNGGGDIRGDPHFTTFDGLRYNFQGLCWHTLVKDCNSALPAFDVKVRFDVRYIDPEVKTRTVEVMITVGMETVTLKEDNSVFVNGTPMTGTGQLKNIKMGKEGNVLVAKFNGLKATWSGPNHILSVGITDEGLKGSVCGLLGNGDGNRDNDFMTADGFLTKDADTFGNSWKVSSMTC
ncbi:BMP-binding endothelial regulator protein-like [Ptychodera flava]|uniref:BMP-binding endothelial regulator protein-like n=1 Tax=Ptychodera flava TaxID=63121 RepID=UPI00396A2C0D